MATVYLVKHRQLGGLHALKVLDAASTSLKQRLLREGQVQARLNHPNVVQVTDVLDLGGTPGLLMEHCDGGDLGKWLQQNRPTVSEAIEIFQGVLAGVKAAHNQGVIHRDLKPANVLLKREGEIWVPKVTDFGLAKRAIDGDSNGLTRTGAQMGTPAYMAPEQVRSSKTVDSRADIFALGCILYELLCEERAFKGQDTFEVFRGIVEEDYRSPREVSSELDDCCVSAIEGCLAARAEQRIPDCETLRRVLLGEQEWVRPEASSPTTTFALDETSDPRMDSRPTLELPKSLNSLADADASRSSSARVWGLVLAGVVGVAGVILWPSNEGETGESVAQQVPQQANEAQEWASADPLPVVQEPNVLQDGLGERTALSSEGLEAESENGEAEAVKESQSGPASDSVSASEPVVASRGLLVLGEGEAVLSKPGREDIAPGQPVPPGTYTIKVRFSDGVLRHGGNVTVSDGESVAIRCSAESMTCSKE